MKYLLQFFMGVLVSSFVFTNNNHPTQNQIDEILHQTMQTIWTEAMIAKQAINQSTPNLREELLENLCSSAPNSTFVTHADLSDSLTSASNTSASIFVSTDNQSSWIENTDVGPLNQPSGAQVTPKSSKAMPLMTPRPQKLRSR